MELTEARRNEIAWQLEILAYVGRHGGAEIWHRVQRAAEEFACASAAETRARAQLKGAIKELAPYRELMAQPFTVEELESYARQLSCGFRGISKASP